MGEGDTGITIDEDTIRRYENARYGIAGNHSAVQMCDWTRKALRGKGVCYKQKFYGVDCHRCAQMSPAFAWCQESCVHCWRPAEWMKKTKMEENEVDDPQLIIDEIVKKRKTLISGVGGAEDADRQLFKESFDRFPSHWAISLSGEPTIYPRLGEMVSLLRKNKEVRSIFIVTNGQEPHVFVKMKKKGQLPTQLYVSVSAPNEELFKKLNCSVYPDGWQRLNRTLEMLPSLGCRTVIRLTLIKGMNDSEKNMHDYAEMFERAKPDFIEVKSYMHLGLSRKRLKRENMPLYDYVRKWSEKLESHLPSYRIESEDTQSRVVLLKKDGSIFGNFIKNP
jgi:tRNA wybutosine-synthesizing protein 1